MTLKSRKLARLVSLALSVVVSGALLSGTAWAPKNLFTNVFGSTCTLSPDNGEAPGSFDGDFTLDSFTLNKDGELAAVGTVTGTCTRSTVTESFTETITAPVDVTVASCEAFDFTLEGSVDNAKGTLVDVSPARVMISQTMGYPGGVFCAIGKLAANGDETGLVRVLNRMLVLPDQATKKPH
jgi:hypothetical protein